jgi:hypothetical protein
LTTKKGTLRKLSVLDVHQKKQEGSSVMIEPRATAVTIQQEPNRAPAINLVRTTSLAIGRVGVWAGDTAQQFGTLVAILMGPAVFSAYAFAIWALAGNLGWTESFIFTSGALSNWIVWLSVAVLVNTAAAILRKNIPVLNTDKR